MKSVKESQNPWLRRLCPRLRRAGHEHESPRTPPVLLRSPRWHEAPLAHAQRELPGLKYSKKPLEWCQPTANPANTSRNHKPQILVNFLEATKNWSDIDSCCFPNYKVTHTGPETAASQNMSQLHCSQCRTGRMALVKNYMFRACTSYTSVKHITKHRST